MKKESGDKNVSRYFTCNGVNATHIRFVYSVDDVAQRDLPSYKPTHCHQVYNSDETIFGYRSLSVDIYYNALTMNCLLDIRYLKKVKEDAHTKADNIEKMLSPWLPKGYTKDKKKFVTKMQKQNSKLLGVVRESFRKNIAGRGRCDFKITEIDTNDPDFRDLHQRFQSVIVWYIDAASFIDLSDPKWLIFYLYEYRNREYYPVGFCTIYQFYKHPGKIRARISQFLILPSHQRAGLGTRLLKAVYRTFWERQNIADITVEDPSLGFQRMRDIVDCNLLCELYQFSNLYVLKHTFCRNTAESAENRRVKQRLKWPYERDMRVFKRKNFGFYHKSLLNQRPLYAKPSEVIDKQFKKYLDEIFPIVLKLEKMNGGEVV
ncbi:histone acetyltransferase type B catalytic subunit-like, partial [Agrilus planipennis]|uniref:histone acetyltransferase n=1 Tax=Agrilus planipennis TaxID=224129 RepID=A0A7F5RHC6_AGRPL